MNNVDKIHVTAKGLTLSRSLYSPIITASVNWNISNILKYANISMGERTYFEYSFKKDFVVFMEGARTISRFCGSKIFFLVVLTHLPIEFQVADPINGIPSRMYTRIWPRECLAPNAATGALRDTGEAERSLISRSPKELPEDLLQQSQPTSVYLNCDPDAFAKIQVFGREILFRLQLLVSGTAIMKAR